MTDKGSKASIGELAWPGLACWFVVAIYFVYTSAEARVAEELSRDRASWFVVPMFATWLVSIVYAFKSSRANVTEAVRMVSGLINASATLIVPVLVVTQGKRLWGSLWIEEHLVSAVVAGVLVLLAETMWKPRSKAGRFAQMIWPALGAGVFYVGMGIASSEDNLRLNIREAAGSGWFWMTMTSGLMVLLTPVRDGTAGQKLAANVVNASPVVFYLFFRHQQSAIVMFQFQVYVG